MIYLFITAYSFGCVPSPLRRVGPSLLSAGSPVAGLPTGSVAPRPVGSELLDQGSNLHPLHWQVDS